MNVELTSRDIQAVDEGISWLYVQADAAKDIRVYAHSIWD